MGQLSNTTWRTAVAGLALAGSAGAAIADQCGSDETRTWAPTAAEIVDAHNARATSLTDGDITASVANGRITALYPDMPGEPYSSNIYTAGHGRNGNPDVSDKLWDGPNGQGPDGMTFDPAGDFTFDEVQMTISDILGSENNPTDVGGTFHIYVDFANAAHQDGFISRIVEPPGSRADRRDGVTTISFDLPHEALSIRVEPSDVSIGFAEVELTDERDACPTPESDGNPDPTPTPEAASDGDGTLGDDNVGDDNDSDQIGESWNRTGPEFEALQERLDRAAALDNGNGTTTLFIPTDRSFG